jgi:hypothetical protein
MLNVAMPKIGLQSPRIMSGIGQGEAAGMPEHMRMGLEIEAGRGSSTLDHPGEAGRGRTVRFLMVGDTNARRGFAMRIRPAGSTTV